VHYLRLIDIFLRLLTSEQSKSYTGSPFSML